MNKRYGLRKMSRQFFSRIWPVISLAALMLLQPSYTQCAEKESKGPTVITSKRFFADKKASFAVFEGSVIAKNEEMTLYSDKMKVYYNKEGDINEIIAEGSVKLLKDGGVITSSFAIYNAPEQKITFTGEPRAVEGGNIVTGSRMIYLIDEERSIVENSKVFLEGSK